METTQIPTQLVPVVKRAGSGEVKGRVELYLYDTSWTSRPVLGCSLPSLSCYIKPVNTATKLWDWRRRFGVRMQVEDWECTLLCFETRFVNHLVSWPIGTGGRGQGSEVISFHSLLSLGIVRHTIQFLLFFMMWINTRQTMLLHFLYYLNIYCSTCFE